jgi:hypothetical protein
MTEPSKGSISPTSHLYKVQGRAAEIARSFGCQVCAPEHLFLGMLHDGGWPVTTLAGLVDLAQAEAAVLALINAPGYTPPPPLRFPQRDGHVRPWGAYIAFELGDDYHGLEHELLEMLRYREGVPARALASLAGLDAIEAAVLAAKNAPPPGPPADAIFLPDGMELDRPLRRALADALPEETTWGYSTYDGRKWIHIFGPSEATDDALTHEVLNQALAAIGRPPLEG